MGHLEAALGQEDGEPPAAGTAVKDGVEALQAGQQFPLDVVLLDDVIDVDLLPAALQFPPCPAGSTCALR